MTDSDLLAPVLTKAALLKKDESAKFKAEVFELPRLRKNTGAAVTRKKEDGISEEMEKTKADGPEFDMKRARQEVFNLGVTGFKSKNKRKTQIALAVKLGAKPPKKMYKNYKELLEEKKRTKQLREEHLRLRQLGKNQTGAATIRYKKPKLKKKTNSGEISKHYGVVNPKITKSRK